VRDGEVEVVCAPILPFLKAPDRATALRKPFKLPDGAAAHGTPAGEGGARRTLGARRRSVNGMGGGCFKRPAGSDAVAAAAAPVVVDAAAAAAEAAAVDAAAVAAGAAALAAAAEGEMTWEPLVLWEAPEPAAPSVDGAVKEEDAGAAEAGAEPPPPPPQGRARVEVEGVVCRFLREHQREGVQFMFDCVHGLKDFDGHGCILADDMGLGKTLQSITLLLTVLRQGLGGGAPTARRAIVVCPTSLVANWAKEIAKWVGDRIKPLPLAEASRDQATMDIHTFLTTRTYHVLIISYETFRIHAPRFQERADSCDLLICDEAHRLKNERTLTTQALAGLACRRRVLLSGTPVQNDLDELFAMIDFTNPGILGDAAAFRRRFAGPIQESREPWASERVKAAGEEATRELSSLLNKFVLRRTNTLLSKHLPPKLQQVVCVRLSPLQRALYDHFLSSKELSLIMSGTQKGVLSSITALRKLVNHPKLIFDVMQAHKHSRRSDDGAAGFEDAEQFFPPTFARERSACPELSGKFELAARMLHLLRTRTDDRIVIVSCYTQTLDLFSALCRERHWPWIRLDGSTTPGKRQKLVDKFNDPRGDEFVFLLSSRAGGCGLNLIGGNRLILFDPDWNPATDLQAAARVWRDGQRKKVYVYRFLATGTLEEKVFQRQMSKKGLQTIVVEEGDETTQLSSEDLRNLFTLNEDTPCDTHDMLRCDRCLRDELAAGESDAELAREANEEASAARAAAMADATAAGAAAAAAVHAAAAGGGAGGGAAAAAAAAAGTEGADVDGSGAAAKRLKTDAAAAGSELPTDAASGGVVDSDSSSERGGGKRKGATPRGGRRGAAAADIASEGTASERDADEDDDGGGDDDDDEDDDDDDAPRGRRRPAGGKGKGKGAKGSKGKAGGKGKGKEGGGEAGEKRKRAPKGESKAAVRRAAKAAEAERREFEATLAAAIKSSLAKPLAPVPVGTVRRQLKYPAEDDLKNWSHHCGVGTVADDILRERGGDLVSSVFRPEVRGKDVSGFAPRPRAGGPVGARALSRPVRAAVAAAPRRDEDGNVIAPAGGGGADAAGSVAATAASPAASSAAAAAATPMRRALPTTVRRPGGPGFRPPTTFRSPGSALSATTAANRASPSASAAKGRGGGGAAAAASAARRRSGSDDDDDSDEDDGYDEDDGESSASDAAESDGDSD